MIKQVVFFSPIDSATQLFRQGKTEPWTFLLLLLQRNKLTGIRWGKERRECLWWEKNTKVYYMVSHTQTLTQTQTHKHTHTNKLTLTHTHGTDHTHQSTNQRLGVSPWVRVRHSLLGLCAALDREPSCCCPASFFKTPIPVSHPEMRQRRIGEIGGQ